MSRGFAGSYDPDDCTFLLKPIAMPADNPTDPGERERLIQSGRAHYSLTIPHERAPDPAYMALFTRLEALARPRFAAELRYLAARLAEKPGPLTLVSLARAGTPIGVLLRRALRRFHGIDAPHYAISIIRDRGLDEQALAYLLHDLGRPPAGLIFIDGWTAKGAITRELKAAVADWNRVWPGHALSGELWVVADPGGQADVAATSDDYVIPSGILNAVISGLVSRSSLLEVGPGDFHSCVPYDHLREQDLSTSFVDGVEAEMARVVPAAACLAPAVERRRLVAEFLTRIGREHRVSDLNRIKPGIAEATRALLRRKPGLLLIKDPDAADVAHALLLARQKGVPVQVDAAMPFQAATLIQDVV